MTHDEQTLRDDIAYVRQMAEDGRHGPLLSGPILVAAGSIFGLTSVGQWAIGTGTFAVSPWAQLWLWVGSGVIFGLVLAVLLNRMKGQAGYRASNNRAVGAAWSTVGYSIFVTWLALVALSAKTGNWSWMAVMPTIVLVAYGSSWLIGGAMAGTRWMSYVGLLAYLGAVAVAWFVDSPAIYLVFAAILAVVAFIPGLVMMRQEKSGTI